MNKKITFQNMMLVCTMVLVSSVFNFVSAQTDTVRIIEIDTVYVIERDTIYVESGTVAAPEKEKKAKRKDEFIVFAGPNLSNLNVSSEDYESSAELGYHFGFSYRRGRFFYWQLGAEFSSSKYEFQSLSNPSDLASFAVKSIDVPITGGINLLSATNRILGLRAFVSLVPSYAIGVGDNGLNLDTEDINSFLFSGQLGVGVNVAFFIVDVGYKYGFNDIIPDAQSKPGQAFVNIGFRF